MLGLGFICDKLFGDLLPEDLQWLADIGCAGLDAATGNFPGAAILGAKAAQDGARAAGQKDAAEGIGIAADAAGAVAGEPMAEAHKICGPFGCGVPTFADSGRLRGESLLSRAAPRAAGAGMGAAVGGVLGGKEGARTGVKAGAGLPGADVAKSAAGAFGVCTGAIVSAIKGKGVKDFQKGFEVGSNAASLTSGVLRLEFNPAQDKKSIIRAAAVLGHRGGALVGSLDAAARKDDKGHRPVQLATDLAAASLSIPASVEACVDGSDGRSRARAAFNVVEDAARAGLDIASLSTSPRKKYRQLDRARETQSSAASLVTELWDRAAVCQSAAEKSDKKGK